jgi:hypothetical protein
MKRLYSDWFRISKKPNDMPVEGVFKFSAIAINPEPAIRFRD